MITDPIKRQERRQALGNINDQMNQRRREKSQSVAKMQEERRQERMIATGNLVEDEAPKGKKAKK